MEEVIIDDIMELIETKLEGLNDNSKETILTNIEDRASDLKDDLDMGIINQALKK